MAASLDSDDREQAHLPGQMPIIRRFLIVAAAVGALSAALGAMMLIFGGESGFYLAVSGALMVIASLALLKRRSLWSAGREVAADVILRHALLAAAVGIGCISLGIYFVLDDDWVSGLMIAVAGTGFIGVGLKAARLAREQKPHADPPRAL